MKETDISYVFLFFLLDWKWLNSYQNGFWLGMITAPFYLTVIKQWMYMQDSRLRASADQQLLHDADRFIKKKRRQDLTEGKTQTVHSASSVTPLCTSRRGELEEKVWWEAEEFKKKINKRIEDGAGGQIRTLLNPLWHGYNEAKHETINHTSPKV